MVAAMGRPVHCPLALLKLLKTDLIHGRLLPAHSRVPVRIGVIGARVGISAGAVGPFAAMVGPADAIGCDRWRVSYVWFLLRNLAI